MKDERLQLRIDPALKEWLRTYASRQGQDMSAVIETYLRRAWRRDQRGTPSAAVEVSRG